MNDDVVKLLLTLAFPLVAFISLIIWMAVVMSKQRSLSVNLKFIGLSLSVSAFPAGLERRGLANQPDKDNAV